MEKCTPRAEIQLRDGEKLENLTEVCTFGNSSEFVKTRAIPYGSILLGSPTDRSFTVSLTQNNHTLYSVWYPCAKKSAVTFNLLSPDSTTYSDQRHESNAMNQTGPAKQTANHCEG